MSAYDEEVYEPSDQVPLLGRRDTAASRLSHIRIPETGSVRVVLAIIYLTCFMISTGAVLTENPAVRIFENIICHQFYERQGPGELDREIPEEFCKGTEVQSELAVLIAGISMFSVIPSLILCLPYGILADRIGRKPVLILAFLGILLAAIWDMIVAWFWRTFPLRLVWFGSAFRIIGGGDAVVSATIFAILADTVAPENRANAFLMATGTTFAAEFLGPPLAAYLMDRSPWLAVFLGIGILISAVILLLFIPETLYFSKKPTTTESDESDLPQTFVETLKAQTHNTWANFQTLKSTLYSPTMALLVVAFLTHQHALTCLSLIPRYISARFGWKLSQVTLLQSLRSVISIVVMMGILPGVGLLLRRFKYTSKERDLLMARVTGIIIILGSIAIGASDTVILTIIGLAIFTIGAGYHTIVKSLMTSLVDQEHCARLLAALAVVDNAMVLAGTPLFTALFNAGLRLGSFWRGMPFYVLAVLIFLTIVPLFFIRLGSRADEDEEEV